jgi:ubiquitin carboxyl-terminal hydrolase L5
MFNLLAVRSDPIPRLTRQLADTSLPAQQQYSLGDQLEHEQHKAKQGHVENTLRRNNLLPVVFELFKALGQKGNIGTSLPRSAQRLPCSGVSIVTWQVGVEH